VICFLTVVLLSLFGYSSIIYSITIDYYACHSLPLCRASCVVLNEGGGAERKSIFKKIL
jgi:hypothetical protein